MYPSDWLLVETADIGNAGVSATLRRIVREWAAQRQPRAEYDTYKFGIWLHNYNAEHGTDLRPSTAQHLVEQAIAENYGLPERQLVDTRVPYNT